MVEFQFEDFARKNERIVVSKSVYLQGELSPHSHNFVELVYVLRGNGLHIINDKKESLKQGDFFIVGNESFHTFLPSSKDFVWINCFFLPEAASSLYEADKSNQIIRFLSQNGAAYRNQINLRDVPSRHLIKEVENLFETMLKEYNRQSTNYQQIIESYLLILLLKIIPHIHASSPRDKQNSLADHDDLEQVVINFFSKQSSYENVHISDIANALYVNPKYFSNVFKKRTGKNLSDFIQRIKIKRAIHLLENSNMNILEIMNMVGYKDSKFFYTLFKKETGYTPGDYRRNYRLQASASAANDRIASKSNSTL